MNSRAKKVTKPIWSEDEKNAPIAFRMLLCGDETNGTHVIFEDLVAPGMGPNRHIHHLQDETFFFLEGQFDVEIDGQLFHFGPGDIGFVPKGSIHTFKNVGETPGRLRYIFTPALDIENMFEEIQNALVVEKLSPEEAIEIINKFEGQEVVGPPL